jgi:hypothetical protein
MEGRYVNEKKRGWKKNVEENGGRDSVETGVRGRIRREERTEIKKEEKKEARTDSTCMSGWLTAKNRYC